MGPVGVQEMVVIFLVALVLFGPKKLPELGKTIGKAITEFRRAQGELKATFDHHMRELERENESLKDVTRPYVADIQNSYLGESSYVPDYSGDSGYHDAPYNSGAGSYDYGSDPYNHSSEPAEAHQLTAGASAIQGADSHVSTETATNGTVPRTATATVHSGNGSTRDEAPVEKHGIGGPAAPETAVS